MEARQPRTRESADYVEEAFRVFDKEGLGSLSAAELRHIMTNLGEKLSEEEVELMLSCADADAQGKIVYKGACRLRWWAVWDGEQSEMVSSLR